MVALRNKADHYIFALWFLSFFLLLLLLSSFFIPRLISAVADSVSAIFPHMVWPLCDYLECRSEMYCTRLDRNAGRKKRQKIAVWAASHKFVGLYLRNVGTYRQSDKKTF